MEIKQYGYSAFGKEYYKNNTSAFGVSNRYTGQILDEDTGLYYYGARYYDPELARFIQPDSVVPEPDNSQALNRYSYCINNPLKYTDPTGNTYIPPSWYLGATVTAFCNNLVTAAVTLGTIGIAIPLGAASSVFTSGRGGFILRNKRPPAGSRGSRKRINANERRRSPDTSGFKNKKGCARV